MTRLTFRTIGTVIVACVDSTKEVSFLFCFVGNSIYIYIVLLLLVSFFIYIRVYIIQN